MFKSLEILGFPNYEIDIQGNLYRLEQVVTSFTGTRVLDRMKIKPGLKGTYRIHYQGKSKVFGVRFIVASIWNWCLFSNSEVCKEGEVWKPLFNEDLYYISNYGRVRNKSLLIMKPEVHKGKYYKIKLKSKGIYKNYRIHRLVALAFISNPNNHPEVNHKDFNGFNNHVDNLEWITGEDNIKHYRDSLK